MPSKSSIAKVSLGFRAHSGWAAVVAVTEKDGGVQVLDRRRIELADPQVRGFPQPYHAAESLPFPQAQLLIDACMQAAGRCAETGLLQLIGDLGKRNLVPAACGLLTSSAKPLPQLDAVLASHALIHTAEGEMFRLALRHAAESCGLAVRTLRERDAYVHTAELLGKEESLVRQAIAGFGGALGPPWREDQKLATLAAWFALQAQP